MRDGVVGVMVCRVEPGTRTKTFSVWVGVMVRLAVLVGMRVRLYVGNAGAGGIDGLGCGRRFGFGHCCGRESYGVAKLSNGSLVLSLRLKGSAVLLG